MKLVSKILIFFVALSAIFLNELSSMARNVFTSEETSNTSMIKQFSEMIISPSQSLKGEENGQINILLLGVGGEGHNGGYLTDTIMILSLKPEKKEAAILSIPRDLYVNIEEYGIAGKINSIQELGNNTPQQNGNELLKQVVEDISGFRIHYFVQLDFEGFIQAIDSLDGIDIYLENDINDPAYPDFNNGYDPFYIKKGWHHVDGSTALKIARSRHSIMGDFDRIKRQQEIIKSVRQKVYEKYEKADVIAFGNTFLSLSNHLQTDLKPKELPRLYQIVKEIKNNNLSSETVDTQKYLERINIGLGYTLGLSEENYKETQKISETIFDIEISEEEKEALKTESALIEIQNATDSPDLANKISNDLELLGFRVIRSSNIVDQNAIGVQINHPDSTEKEKTLDFLVKIFSAKTNPSENYSAEADFTIILGKGF